MIISMTEQETWVEPTDIWVSTDQVIHFHGLKPQHLNLDKTDDYTMRSILVDWIRQSQSLILAYCHIKSLSCQEVSGAMANVCLRLTSNMVNLAIQRRDNPIIKVNDWTIQNVSSDIFTDDLKDDLAPFINDSSNDSGKINFFAITGEDINGGNNL